MTHTSDAATAPRTLSASEQRARIDAEVAKLARDGWTPSTVSDASALLQRKKRIGWFWNLLLSIVTGGLWLIVVLVRVINRKVETVTVSVDGYGKVTRR